MQVELTGPRILAPFFGASYLIWASMISVIFMALSAGYFYGGKIAFQNTALGHLFLFLFFSSFTLALTAFVKDYPLHFVFKIPLPLAIKALVATLILFFAPCFLMATCIFWCSNHILSTSKNRAKTLSRIFILGALGGLSGIWLTVLFILPTFGCETSLIIAAVSCACLCLISLKPTKLNALFLVVWIGALVYSILHPPTKTFIDKDSLYQRIIVFNDKKTNTKVLQLNHHINAAHYTHKNDLVYKYNRFLAQQILKDSSSASVLILGGGGLSLSHYLSTKNKDLHIDVVEIDHTLLETVQQEFNLKLGKNVSLFTADARYFLNETKKTYDVIVWDVCSAPKQIPDHLTTIEVARLSKNALSDKGLIYANILSNLSGPSSKFFYSFYKTYAEVFEHTAMHPLEGDLYKQMQNVILVASKEKIDGAFITPTQTQLTSSYVFTDAHAFGSFL